MTKAALKNMLQLMEDTELGSSLALEQYIEFVLRHGEIMVGSGGKGGGGGSAEEGRAEKTATGIYDDDCSSGAECAPSDDVGTLDSMAQSGIAGDAKACSSSVVSTAPSKVADALVVADAGNTTTFASVTPESPTKPSQPLTVGVSRAPQGHDIGESGGPTPTARQAVCAVGADRRMCDGGDFAGLEAQTDAAPFERDRGNGFGCSKFDSSVLGWGIGVMVSSVDQDHNTTGGARVEGLDEGTGLQRVGISIPARRHNEKLTSESNTRRSPSKTGEERSTTSNLVNDCSNHSNAVPFAQQESEQQAHGSIVEKQPAMQAAERAGTINIDSVQAHSHSLCHLTKTGEGESECSVRIKEKPESKGSVEEQQRYRHACVDAPAVASSAEDATPTEQVAEGQFTAEKVDGLIREAFGVSASIHHKVRVVEVEHLKVIPFQCPTGSKSGSLVTNIVSVTRFHFL